MGIATGPGGIWALDVDVKDDQAEDETVSDLEREHGLLSATLEALAATGRHHLYFAYREEVHAS